VFPDSGVHSCFAILRKNSYKSRHSSTSIVQSKSSGKIVEFNLKDIRKGKHVAISENGHIAL
jgi:hypothetical protein